MSWDATTTATVLTAACTAGATIATAVMAWFTRRAIVESHAQFEKTRAQSEQHHQDGFRPILVMSPVGGAEPNGRSTLMYIDPTPKSDGTHRCSFSCVMQNVGTGPALNVRIHFRAMGRPGYGFTRELSPVRAGGRVDDPSQFYFLIHPSPTFNSTDITTVAGTSWEVVLEYEDVFGNPFHTIHRKNPQMPWTECGKGPAPVECA